MLTLTTVNIALAKEDSAEPMRVTVAKAEIRELVEKEPVTGMIVPAREILVSAELDGQSILEILSEIGDKVLKGQVLARLSSESFHLDLAHNRAKETRVVASISRARDLVKQRQIALRLAQQNFDRTKQLYTSGVSSQSEYDKRINDLEASRSRMAETQGGLDVALAERKIIDAERAKLQLQLKRSEIRAPQAGVVFRRAAKRGMIVSRSSGPLFWIIGDGSLEFDAKISEKSVGKIKIGDAVEIRVGDMRLKGKTRLLPSEIDSQTRLGRLRISLEAQDVIPPVGSFGSGYVVVKRVSSVAVPFSALSYQYDPDERNNLALLKIVVEGQVVARKVSLGIMADGYVEIKSGLKQGELFIRKAGAFLHEGDKVVIAN